MGKKTEQTENDKNADSAKPKEDKKEKVNDSKEKKKESDWSFGEYSWVKQKSNASLSSPDNTKHATSNGSTIPNEDTVDSFAEYTGLGFGSALKKKDENNDKKPIEDKDQKT